ncbi:nucleotide exchange factor GrpE [Spiractinospora alimapuensis]|uniref:nucleotide exchange factor GrpE n=1 Tax=Spiractinospora alimapuensis TaxID=2820884 RepID=UPI001F423115|nr:nucleotide exchange factor GrpE [Spiractinospora alimapuensis]QVQ50576.1 nucleotide exchange factor GrpE [Spiractinospora alimapuensis]
MARPEQDNDTDQDGPVIRDNRRIDPKTFQARSAEAGEPTVEEAEKQESEGVTPESEPSDAEATAAATDQTDGGVAEDVEGVRQQLAERTADLQRVQAEYANYRKRVDRDRAATRDQALIQVLGELLPVLDDIGRARDHDELTGGFRSVGESLEALVTKFGLEKYGEQGDTFDPTVHEALTMVPTPGLSTPTVIEVFQPGYRVEERVVRPARVVVGGPADEPEEAAESAAAPPEDNESATAEESDGAGDATEASRE